MHIVIIPCQWIQRLNILNRSIPLKLICKFNKRLNIYQIFLEFVEIDYLNPDSIGKRKGNRITMIGRILKLFPNFLPAGISALHNS